MHPYVSLATILPCTVATWLFALQLSTSDSCSACNHTWDRLWGGLVGTITMFPDNQWAWYRTYMGILQNMIRRLFSKTNQQLRSNNPTCSYTILSILIQKLPEAKTTHKHIGLTGWRFRTGSGPVCLLWTPSWCMRGHKENTEKDVSPPENSCSESC